MRKIIEPSVDWLPLGVATFQFQMSMDGKVLADEKYHREIRYSLECDTGAEVKIDPRTGTFTFDFGTSLGRRDKPWNFLRDPSIDLSGDDRSIIKLMTPAPKPSDEFVAREREKDQKIRLATYHIWRSHMVPDFNAAVEAGAAVLYARSPTLASDFQRILPDVWRHLEVTDWELGTAIAPDGTRYWSIQVEVQIAQQSAAEPKKASRELVRRELKAIYDEAETGKPPNMSKIRPLVRARLREKGYKASDREIYTVASAPEFAARRRQGGRTLRHDGLTK